MPGRPDWGGGRKAIAPFHLNTQQDFGVMRVSGTPHSWPDSQAAWDQGRMNNWPKAKQNHSLGYFARADLPFQFALAEAFTRSTVWATTLPGRRRCGSSTGRSSSASYTAMFAGAPESA